VLIRDAVLADVPAMFEVRGSVDENRQTREELAALGITDDSVRRDLAEHLRGWIAEVDGRVVGFSFAHGGRGTVWGLFVLPAFQGRGLGSLLLSRASAWLFAAGFQSIYLSTNPTTPAYTFYQRRGWRDAGESSKEGRRLELDRTPGP
jgi:GNAT superfamily N-acetyltransferase